MTDFKDTLSLYQQRVAVALDQWLPAEDEQPERLNQAMRYSMNAGGKRIRPVLCYATGVALGVNADTLDGPAAALELIHTYSLIHDDLPAMDDDDLRRGFPTCHKQYDEATAILAGDGMLTQAFSVLSEDYSMQQSAETRLKMIQVLAQASGVQGMVGGQAIDIAAEGRQLTLDELKNMHAHKTGALIRAAVQLGALSAPQLDANQYEKLTRYAECIGLAFQIRDDILDVISDTETLGKQQGADAALNKPTYTALLGLEGAQAAAKEVHQEALGCLDSFGKQAQLLRDIANYIVERAY
jgi:farnesyl diphosphate synthase